MANLQFLRGTQAKLNDIKNKVTGAASVQDGAFYLTTDTSRLYVGQGAELVELNKSVTTVSTLSNLPKNTRKDNSGTTGEIVTRKVENGQFYYVEDINVLCVYYDGKDGNGRDADTWKQINPDTKLSQVDSTITDLTADASSDSGVSIVDTFTQKLPGEVETTPVSNTNKFKGKNLKIEKLDEDSVLFTADTYAMSAKAVTDTGHTAENPKYKSKEVNIDLTRTIAANNESADETQKTSTDTIVITGTEGIQSISASGNTITIKPTTIQSMENVGGTNGRITISTIEKEGGTTTSTSLKPVVRYGKTTATAKVLRQAVNADGTLKYDADGQPVYEEKEINRKSTSETFDNFFVEDGIRTYEMDLDVYTISEVDSIKNNLEESIKDHIRANNAMTFKGTITKFVSVADSLPAIADKVSVGDTWMISSFKDDKTSLVVGTVTYKIGDVFIATGTEATTGDTEGFITSDLTWNYIPAGNDTYVTKWKDDTKAFEIVDGQNSDNVIGSVNVKATGNVEVSAANVGTSAKPQIEYTLSHKALTDTIKENLGVADTASQGAAGTTTASTTTNINVVDALSVDGDGHVTAWKNKVVTLVDSHNRLDASKSLLEITPASTGTNKDKQVTMSSTVQMTDGDTITQTYNITSSAKNININGNNTAGSKKVEFSLVWGEF